MTVRLAVAALAAAFLAGVSAATAAPPSGVTMKSLQGVNFVNACAFSHRGLNDPIVYPRKPGASHDHTFVGNRSTNAFSTRKSLVAASSSCRRDGDTAAYWMPTLFFASQAVIPRGATIYYRRKTLEAVRPFPAGLKMIAGNSHSTVPQDVRVVFWNCGAESDVAPSPLAPTCPDAGANSLRLHVNFPNCWDGKRLDTADHQSHMAYSIRGSCPVTHPVAVPAISLIFRYPITGGPGVALSSGAPFTAHADFFNAWNQTTLASLVDGCLNALRHCGHDS